MVVVRGASSGDEQRMTSARQCYMPGAQLGNLCLLAEPRGLKRGPGVPLGPERSADAEV